MFGKREPSLLKEHLIEIDRDVKQGKLNEETANRQRREILNALKQLGEKLGPSELQLMERLALDSVDITKFMLVPEPTGMGEMAVDIVGKEVKATQDT